MQEREPMRAVGAYEPDYCYHGDRPEWLVLYVQTRDSDALTRSNFRVLYADLLEQFGDEAVAVEYFGHWAFGHCDKLIVNPTCADAVAAADAWRQRLLDYPVASDDDHSELEWEETQELLDDAASRAVSCGHTVAPERWESDNGYEYAYTCDRCHQDVVVNADTHCYTIPDCLDDDDDANADADADADA